MDRLARKPVGYFEVSYDNRPGGWMQHLPFLTGTICGILSITDRIIIENTSMPRRVLKLANQFWLVTLLFSAAVQGTNADEPETDDAVTHYQQAVALEAAGRWSDAVEQYTAAIRLQPDQAALYDRRGGAYFKLGEIEKSLADFDQAIELEPAREEDHWRRGISLYYAGRYKEGSQQFELGKSVYANDVENAVWRFICQARAEGLEQARAELLPIGNDRRVPLMEVYALFQQKATPDDVLTAAGAGDPDGELLEQQMFYAHLYLGLYFESHNQPEEAAKHIRLAAEKYPLKGHYMWDVARVHHQRLQKQATTE